MKKRIISALLAISMIFTIAPCVLGGEAMPELKEYGFIETNDGAKIEYGIYGNLNGKPLLLLPCNGNDMHNFDGNILPEMAKHYKVICISPRGSGKSDRGTGKLTFDVMADDLVCVLNKLNINKTYIYGFSDGGNLGIVFTLKYPQYVEKLAVMGANINTQGTKFFDQLWIEIEYTFMCIKAWITKDPEDELERDIQGMMVGQPDLTYDDLKAINIPVLNIYGESDMIKRSHSEKITESISGAKGLMVVGGGHSSCFDYTDTVLNPALLEFFGE